jgi:tetratricopeptide (TPR) repeat protein
MNSFIADLKSHLPQSDWPLVVAALRNEPTLWAELQESGFGAQALEASADHRSRWSPGFLGLLRLNQAEQFVGLRADPMQAVAEKLRYQAASAYEQLATDGVPANRNVPTLEQAALLALALRERRRLLNSWEQLSDDLSIAPPQFWKLPIALLFGLLPNPQELLAALMASTQSDEMHELGIHALVSTPLPLDEQSTYLLEIISTYERPQFLIVLRKLAHVHMPLAQQAALLGLENINAKEDNTKHPIGGGVGTRHNLSQIERLLLQAEIRQISGRPGEATPLLHAAWGASQQFQQELADKLAESAAQNGDASALPESEALSKSIRNREHNHPATLISAARVALKSGDSEEAERMADAALKTAQKSGAQENPTLMRQLGELFLDLQQPAQAKQAATLATDAAPNDAENAAFLSKVLSSNGEKGEALQAAHLAAALSPERIDLRRQLAKALQAAGQGAESFAEWKAVLAQEESPAIEDLFALAEAALASDEIQACIEACQRVLAAQATHGAAHALLGKALLAQGDDSSAMEHLRRATELAPAQSEAWLALAQQQRAQGNILAARDTLLNAQQFSKPSAELQALLADIYLALDEKNAALAAFSRAAELAADRADSAVAPHVALQLGKLQRELGYLNQARHTLERAHQTFPADAALAHQYAKVLLVSGEAKSALAALTITLQADPKNSDALLDAARAQLAPGGEASKAEDHLRAVLAGKDVPAEARALLAEALAAQGKHAEAGKQFEAALVSELAQDATWSKRLTLGKALAQAASGKPDAAIATLEEMDKGNPGDLDVLRALCNAYGEAGRTEEAFQIASKVYLNAPKNEETILWFAEQAESLGKGEEARKALNKGIKESAGSPKQVQRLAELHWQDGAHEKAVDALSILLNSGNREALAKAGRFLLEHGAAATSVSYFTRAVEASEKVASEKAAPDLLDALTDAYEQSQQYIEALGIVEKSIAAEPKQPGLLSKKASLLQKAGRPQAALEALGQALELLPEDVNLLANKARLLRSSQDWAGALDAAEKAFRTNVANAEALQLAAELALANLQPERARAFFAEAKLNGETSTELACLQTELALDANEELQAAKSLAPALESAEITARVLALQAQLAARRDDVSQAEQYLNDALSAMGANFEQHKNAHNLQNTARAAQKLNKWDTAVKLLQVVAKHNPGQPLAQFNLGKAIVQRAEWQQLCEASAATHAAPGNVAVSKETHTAAKAAFAAALSAAPGARNQIEGWQARAELRFSAKTDSTNLPKGYPSNAGEAAALIYAARRSGEIKAAEESVKAFSKAAEVLAERALASAELEPHNALKLMLGAIEQKPRLAAYHSLAAAFAEKTSQTDLAVAQIKQAVGLAPEEAAWQAVAGKLHQQTGALGEAIHYLNHAVALQPESAKYVFELGSAQLTARAVSDAVQSFEKAVKLQPKSAEYALALAKAYKETGDLKQAKEKAAYAQKLAPNTNAAVLLQAEIALEDKEAANAKGLAEQAIRLAPKDAVALRMYAESLHALGQTADAIAVLERAEAQAEDAVPYQIRRAQLQGDKGLEELVQLSQKHMDRPDVYFALSEMLAAHGETQDAIQAAQRAAKKAADTLPRYEQARLHLHLGQLLKHSGQLDQSLHHLDEAAKLAPHLIDSQIERGRVFLARRQYTEAMDAFQKASEIAPHNAQPHIESALALKEAKDYYAAEKQLRLAAKLAPKDRTIQRQLAAVIALNLIHQPQEVSAA